MDLTHTRFILCLALLALFIGTANTPADARMSSSFTPAEPLSHITGTGAAVVVAKMLVRPGITLEDEVMLPIFIVNPTGQPVAGIQFDLMEPLNDFQHSNPDSIIIDPALADKGYQLEYSDPDSNSRGPRVVIFSIPANQNGTVNYLDGHIFPVAWIIFETNNTPQSLGQSDAYLVKPGSVIVSNEHGTLIGAGWVDGAIQIGIRNDVNLDVMVNVQDIVVFVRNWLNNIHPFGSSDFQETLFKIYDGNADHELNVADAVMIVNRILGRLNNHGGNEPPPTKVTGGAPIVVDLGSPALQLGGQLAIPVLLNADALIAGGEMAFSFDPEVMTVGEPYLQNKTSDFILQSKVEDGVVRLMVISLSKNKGLATGNQPAVMIPIELMDNREGILTLDSATLVNQFAQQLPVRLGEFTQAVDKAMLTPTAFALRNNAPNPFNPTTTISYEVPQQAHIQLVIYNILGQEVIRLVDEVKSAGRYTVVWDAHNSLGRAVTSGIYLYRLSSSNGFSDAKRMTLLK